MKFARLFAALVLTGALFIIASSGSEGRPEWRTYAENGYEFEFFTVPKIMEFESDSVAVWIRGDMEGKTVLLRHSEIGAEANTPHGDYASQALTIDPDDPSLFHGRLTAGKKLKRVYYFFEVTDTAGVTFASFFDHDDPFWLRGIGDVPKAVLASHVFLIFFTVFCILMATFHAMGILFCNTDVRPVAIWFFASVVAAFWGGYPIGFAMNWYAFGGIWEGIPFGTDATDNKTQILFLYLILMWLSTLGSLTRGKIGRDFFTPKILAGLSVGAMLTMVVVYFIPHSIQFEPSLTYTVCYGWTALMFAIWLWGYLGSRRTS